MIPLATPCFHAVYSNKRATNKIPIRLNLRANRIVFMPVYGGQAKRSTATRKLTFGKNHHQ